MKQSTGSLKNQWKTDNDKKKEDPNKQHQSMKQWILFAEHASTRGKNKRTLQPEAHKSYNLEEIETPLKTTNYQNSTKLRQAPKRSYTIKEIEFVIKTPPKRKISRLRWLHWRIYQTFIESTPVLVNSFRKYKRKLFQLIFWGK